jgi:hypothetical protein
MRALSKHAARTVCLVALTTLAMTSPVVAADTPRERARRLFQKGRSLYNQERYPAALDKFQGASKLYRSYKIDLSIAFTLEKLDRPAEAAPYYERFLLDQSDRSDTKMEKKVVAKLKRIRRKLAMVLVGTELRGATIEIDGERRGKAPLRHRLYLHPGPHQLAAKRAGRVLFSKDVELRPGQHFWIRHGKGRSGVGPAPASDNSWLTGGAPKKPAASTPFYKKWWFWTAVGAAVVGVTVGVAVGVSGGDDWMPTGDSGTIDLGQ